MTLQALGCWAEQNANGGSVDLGGEDEEDEEDEDLAVTSAQQPTDLGSPSAKRLSNSRREHRFRLRSSLRVLREPHDPRACSDVPCLLLLMPFLVALTAACLVSIMLGDARWLQASWDFHGRLCGIHQDVSARPFVYWPFPDTLSAGCCVDHCPTFEDFVNSRTVTLPRAQPLVLSETTDGFRMFYTQTVWLVDVPVYATSPALGRFCVPAPDTQLVVPAVVPVNVTGPSAVAVSASTAQGPGAGGAPKARDSMLPALGGEFGQPADQLRRTMGAVRLRERQVAACAILGPICCALVLGCLTCCPAGVFLVAVVLSLSMGLLGLGACILLDLALHQTDFVVLTLNSLQPSLEWFVGCGLILSSALLIVASLIFRRVMWWSAACVEVTVRLLWDARLLSSLAWISLVVSAGQVVASIVWVRVLGLAVSATITQWPAELPSVQVGFSGGMVGDDEAEVVPGGPIVRGLGRWPEFRWSPIALVLISALALRLVLAVFASVGKLLITHVIACWYFSKATSADGRRPLQLRPARAAWQVVSGAHLGSAVACAFLNALLPTVAVRGFAVVAHKMFAPWFPNRRGGFCRRVARAAIACAEPPARVIAVALGAAPHTDIAMSARHFHEAVAETATALPRALPAVQFISGLPILFEACVTALIALAGGGALFLSSRGLRHDDATYVETKLGVALLGSFLAHGAASALHLVSTSSFDAVCYCIACDDSHHQSHKVASIDESFALWSSEYTPPRFRALVFEAAQAVQADMARYAGRRVEAFGQRDGASWAYTAVSKQSPPNSGSESEPDS